jgi:hypothetical protein
MKSSVKQADASDLPPFPWALDYLWDWFCQLSMGLSISGMAPAVVTWESLESWARQMDIEVRPREAIVFVELRAQVLMETPKKKPVNDRSPAARKPPRKRT